MLRPSGHEGEGEMKIYKIWAKPPSRAAYPMMEIEPNQYAGWAVYLFSRDHRRFYEWADDAKLEALLKRHRDIGNTVERSEKEPDYRRY
jgi:hypothetical protein